MRCRSLLTTVPDTASKTIKEGAYQILVLGLLKSRKNLLVPYIHIRKVQDARGPTLATKRPSTTVHVYDAVKMCMDEALQNAREDLIPADNAPDIICQMKNPIWFSGLLRI